jgi:hypothetical protein
MSGTTPSGNDTGGVMNPYIRAYKAGATGVGIPHRGKINGPSPAILGMPVIRVRMLEEFAFRTRPYSNASVNRATGQGCRIRLASKIPFYLL